MIYVTSDWHLSKQHTEVLSLLDRTTKEDNVILLGNLADDWDMIENESWFVRMMNQYQTQILLVDGNHEDIKKLQGIPETLWNGMKVHQLGKRIYHILRGQVFYLEGKNFWIMGGDYSGKGYIMLLTDSWQEEETPSRREQQRGLEALIKLGWKVDYILTHTAPQEIIKTYKLSDEVNEFNRYLDEIARQTTFKKWYFGHCSKSISLLNEMDFPKEFVINSTKENLMKWLEKRNICL